MLEYNITYMLFVKQMLSALCTYFLGLVYLNYHVEL